MFIIKKLSSDSHKQCVTSCDYVWRWCTLYCSSVSQSQNFKRIQNCQSSSVRFDSAEWFVIKLHTRFDKSPLFSQCFASGQKSRCCVWTHSMTFLSLFCHVFRHTCVLTFVMRFNTQDDIFVTANRLLRKRRQNAIWHAVSLVGHGWELGRLVSYATRW